MLPRSVLVFFTICLLSACSQFSYYTQAAKGQWQIVSKRQRISQMLQDPELDSDLKNKLQLVQEIRDFAVSDLDLPDNQTFRYYTDLERRFAVWNVIATPVFDMNPKTWCFPIAGCVAYKGYFSEQPAAALQAELVDQEYDTFMYGVTAYSTLGWFSDPVLNTFINNSEISLARLIFHELAHQVVYVKDDSEFNEAFATAVEHAGIERWLIAKHPGDALDSYRMHRKNNDAITEMVLSYRTRLAAIYTEREQSELANLKLQTFEEMRQGYADFQVQGKGTPFYDWWFSLGLNNAHLSSIATYHRLVPFFLGVFDQSESFSNFYGTVRAHARQPKTERDKWVAGSVLPQVNPVTP